MNPFDFLNSINHTKENVMVTSHDEKEYVPYVVNKGLSQFIDTVRLANEMNMRHHTDKKLQYEFLLNSIRKRKRFAKWAKSERNDDLTAVMEYFGYSYDKANDIIDLLSQDDIKTIKDSFSKGGTKNGGFVNDG
jgi:hypothetical protein